MIVDRTLLRKPVEEVQSGGRQNEGQQHWRAQIENAEITRGGVANATASVSVSVKEIGRPVVLFHPSIDSMVRLHETPDQVGRETVTGTIGRVEIVQLGMKCKHRMG